MENKSASTLKEQLEDKKKIIVLPGVYDALSARIAEQIGFGAIFQTGYGSSVHCLECLILDCSMPAKHSTMPGG